MEINHLFGYRVFSHCNRFIHRRPDGIIVTSRALNQCPHSDTRNFMTRYSSLDGATTC
jgi:hypothetical protein